MKKFYNILFVFSILMIPFALQSQDDSSDNEDDWSQYEDGCPLPCDNMFNFMEEIFGDDSASDDGVYYNADEIPVNPCPSTDGMTIKVKVSINAPTGTAAKDSLDKWKATWQGTPAMEAALKKKFKCADCELPGIGKCPQSIESVKITFTNPTGSAGNYKARITVKFKAVCGECPLLRLIPESNINSSSVTTVFPNPGKTSLKVKLELVDNRTAVQFRILDLSGKVVKIIKTTPTAIYHQQDIDILELEDGMYLLECTQGDLLRETIQFTKI